MKLTDLFSVYFNDTPELAAQAELVKTPYGGNSMPVLSTPLADLTSCQ